MGSDVDMQPSDSDRSKGSSLSWHRFTPFCGNPRISKPSEHYRQGSRLLGALM